MFRKISSDAATSDIDGEWLPERKNDSSDEEVQPPKRPKHRRVLPFKDWSSSDNGSIQIYVLNIVEYQFSFTYLRLYKESSIFK